MNKRQKKKFIKKYHFKKYCYKDPYSAMFTRQLRDIIKCMYIPPVHNFNIDLINIDNLNRIRKRFMEDRYKDYITNKNIRSSVKPEYTCKKDLIPVVYKPERSLKE